MPATNSTPTYNLPLYTDSDKPTWRGDVNDTNSKIDAAIKAVDAKIVAPTDVDSDVAGLIADSESDVSAALKTLLASSNYVIVKTGGTGLTAKQLDELSL